VTAFDDATDEFLGDSEPISVPRGGRGTAVLHVSRGFGINTIRVQVKAHHVPAIDRRYRLPDAGP
jgi:hypothetical protein